MTMSNTAGEGQVMHIAWFENPDSLGQCVEGRVIRSYGPVYSFVRPQVVINLILSEGVDDIEECLIVDIQPERKPWRVIPAAEYQTTYEGKFPLCTVKARLGASGRSIILEAQVGEPQFLSNPFYPDSEVDWRVALRCLVEWFFTTNKGTKAAATA